MRGRAAEEAPIAAFVNGAVAGYGREADRLVFLGYSNGANVLAAVIQLHQGLVRRAVLLRGLQALENPSMSDLSDTALLIIAGRDDPNGAGGARLAQISPRVVPVSL